MRPLLRVLFVPSIPMKEERLWTPILEDDTGQSVLAPGHRGEGDVLRSFGDAEDDSGVLDGEKSFGNVDIQKNGANKSSDGDEDVVARKRRTNCNVRP